MTFVLSLMTLKNRYMLPTMNRVTAALQVLLLLAGLLALAVPPDLACCAGAVEVHGAGCCESAATDAMARSCCEGDAAVGQRSDPPPAVGAFVQPNVAARPAVQAPVPGARTEDALPRGVDLFTLHSAWLI